MRIEERQIKTLKTEKIYISKDNIDFRSEKECLQHEELLDLKSNMKHIKSKSVDIIDSTWGEAYYVSNEKDYQTVCDYYCKSYPIVYKCYGEWNFEGENWYILHAEDSGDDRPNTLYCYTLDYYKKLINEFLQQFEEKESSK